jgi:hypothetical protein
MWESGQRHAPAALCPGERTPGTHCTRGWVGPRAGLDTEATGKKSFRLYRGSNLDRPVVQPVARHYTEGLCGSLALCTEVGKTNPYTKAGGSRTAGCPQVFTEQIRSYP